MIGNLRVWPINIRLKIRRVRPKSGFEMGFGLKQLGLEYLGPKIKINIKIKIKTLK